MSMSLSNIYSDDMELEILTREFVLDIETIQHELIHANNLYEEQSFFEDAEVEEKTDKIFVKIAKAIKEQIEKLFDYIREFFKQMGMGYGEKLKVSDYMQSETARIQLTGDLEEFQKQTQRELAEGHKIVKLISDKSGIDPVVVKKYTDRIQAFAIGPGMTMLTTFAACKLGDKFNELILGGNELGEEIKKQTEKLEKESDRESRLTSKRFRREGRERLAMLNDMAHNVTKLVSKVTAPYFKIEKELRKYKKAMK